MKIAKDDRITNPTHVSYLPCNWSTLHVLTRLSDEQFRHALQDHAIWPEMERSHAQRLLGFQEKKPKSRTEQPDQPDALALISKPYFEQCKKMSRRARCRELKRFIAEMQLAPRAQARAMAKKWELAERAKLVLAERTLEIERGIRIAETGEPT
jgi:hypothetical protein